MLSDRYRRPTTKLEAQVAEIQLARLGRAVQRQSSPVKNLTRTPSTSRWAHVPLAQLFEAFGNALHVRADGRVESGHEPFHGSKSGSCVLITPESGHWWCRSCNERGDAIRLVMRVNDWSYREAAGWLSAHFGPRELPRPMRPTVTAPLPQSGSR